MLDKNFLGHIFINEVQQWSGFYLCEKCNIMTSISVWDNLQKCWFTGKLPHNVVLTCDEVIIKNIIE